MIKLAVSPETDIQFRTERPEIHFTVHQAEATWVEIETADAVTLEARPPNAISLSVAETVQDREYPDYTGDYEVTSFCADPLMTSSLVLPTRDRRMLDDVTVYSVPTRETYNAAGGVTFEIGG